MGVTGDAEEATAVMAARAAAERVGERAAWAVVANPLGPLAGGEPLVAREEA